MYFLRNIYLQTLNLVKAKPILKRKSGLLLYHEIQPTIFIGAVRVSKMQNDKTDIKMRFINKIDRTFE